MEENVLAPVPHRQYVFTVPKILRPIFSRRRNLLASLCHIAEQLRSILLSWRHSGFSVHNAVRVRAGDAHGRKKLAQYMLRAPFSLEKMTYDDKNGTVIYRSHMHKDLKRNFQVMPGAQWLELLCRHIHDRFEHLVRYVGWYSNRCRALREQAKLVQTPPIDGEDADQSCARARTSWARLIHKVYEVDPLICPVCKGPMHVIALKTHLEPAALPGRRQKNEQWCSPWGAVSSKGEQPCSFPQVVRGRGAVLVCLLTPPVSDTRHCAH